MTVKNNSGEFGSSAIRQAARATVGGIATFGLLIGSGVTATASSPAATPAGATPSYGGGTQIASGVSTTPGGTGLCTLGAGGGTVDQVKNLPLAESGSVTMSRTVQVSRGSVDIGVVKASSQTAAKPVVRNGGLTQVDIGSSGSVSFQPSGTSTNCGDAAGLSVLAGASAKAIPTQPTGAGGWLTLTVKHSGEGETSVEPFVSA